MISLADLQRRIDSGELSADAAIAQSCEAIEARDKTIGAFVCRTENVRAGQRRSAARHCRRHQGHHRYRGPSDRNGIEDLPGLAAARGCACGDDAEAGRREHRRQDHDDGVRLARSDRDAQSAQPRPHAGRIVLGIGGGGRGRHDSAGGGNADRRFGDPAGFVLRRGRDQAVVPYAADGRREVLFVDAGYRRAVRGRRRRPGARAFGDHQPARTAAGCRDRAAAHRHRDAGFCRRAGSRRRGRRCGSPAQRSNAPALPFARWRCRRSSRKRGGIHETVQEFEAHQALAWEYQTQYDAMPPLLRARLDETPGHPACRLRRGAPDREPGAARPWQRSSTMSTSC